MKKSIEYSDKLLHLTNSAYNRLSDITEVDLSLKNTEKGKWTRKEILGHLIDSASNNHQRFVRTMLSSELAFPAYTGTDWVNIQDYKNAKWKNLLEIWKYYNYHLAFTINQMSNTMLDRHMIIGAKEPITLEKLILSYFEHLEHHLSQI